MAYKLAETGGETTAVPQVVMAHLARADGDAVRVALYILQSGETEPRALAKALGLKSIEAAKRALQYWAGAGLLVKERAPLAGTAAKTAAQKAAEIDLATLEDPYIAVLCEEAQTALGRALSREELQRLVALYLTDGWKPDVLLLCCAEVARRGGRTVAAVSRELGRWHDAGVDTGEEAERYLARQRQREAWWAEAARLFGCREEELTPWERKAVTQWHEEWQFGADMIEEALLHAEGKRVIRYVNAILRDWQASGLTTVAAVRGQGQLVGRNILATQRPGTRKGGKAGAAASAPAATPSGTWNALLDEELKGIDDAYEG